MNFYNLKVIATYNSKLLLRSWLFRVFFLLTFCWILLYQILFQANPFVSINNGLITLSSFFPYMNAYLFVGLQVIPLVFLVGMFLTKERKLDSMDMVYYRPESNVEYVLGMAAGFAWVFIMMAIVSLFFGFLLHFFASDSPVNVWIYLFYLITFIVPSLVFMLSLSFFIHTLIRHQALSILLLLIVVGCLIFYVGSVGQGIFDPFGYSLPNTFSSVTGHSDLTGYLLQRLCWLFVGFGFLGFTICLFKRLSNSPENQMCVTGLSIVCMIAGITVGSLVYSLYSQKVFARKVYTETFNKYNNVPKGSVVCHNISFEQRGDEMSGKSILLIQNRTQETLPEIILYLNPGLEVLSIKGEVNLPFERDKQVIRVRQKLLPDEEIALTIEYQGGIDEQVCYLSVPDNVLFSQEDNTYLQCRYGKRYLFLDQDFTFLTPECLWYPMTTPPVNPAQPYEIFPDFTFYSLQVLNTEERRVIAQGNEEEIDNGVHFTNLLPLPGISLCIGSYEKREIIVDSVQYELYLFKGHDDILRGLEVLSDSLPELIREMKKSIEYKMHYSYPYSRLKLIETPITLTSFFRQEKGTSEFIQPEMVFLPERGVGVWSDYSILMEQMKNQEKRMSSSGISFDNTSRVDRLRQAVLCGLPNLLMNTVIAKYNSWQGFIQRFNPSAIKNVARSTTSTRHNLYYASSMFYDYSLYFWSKDYPIINTVLLNMLQRHPQNLYEEYAIDYLSSHSFEESFYDREIEPAVFNGLLQMKSKELIRRLAIGNITEEQVFNFLNEYVAIRRFQNIDFDQFDETFGQKFGIRCRDVLSSWYTNKQLPEFLIKDFKVEAVGLDEEKANKMRQIISLSSFGNIIGMHGESSKVRLTIFNNSDVDGVVSLQAQNYTSSFGATLTRNYLIKARSGKEIVTHFDGGLVSLNTNLSLNIPVLLNGDMGIADDEIDDYERDLELFYFYPDKDMVTIDNEDVGFRIVQSSPKKRLRDLFVKEQKSKYQNIRAVSIMDGVKVQPGYIKNAYAYGLSKRTHAFMMQGGGASMEWTTQIEREGEYNIYAYMPPKIMTIKMNKQNMVPAVTSKNAGFKQYYTLINGSENREIIGECDGTHGWILLGRYRLFPGECKIVLTDEGEKDQVLLGDAIKWKYVD